MLGNGRRKKKRGTKVPRTEAWFFEKKIQVVKKKIQVVKRWTKKKPLGECEVTPSGYKRDNIPDKKRSLSYLLPRDTIYLLPAEDEDLAVMEDFGCFVFISKDIFNTFRISARIDFAIISCCCKFSAICHQFFTCVICYC